MTKKKDQIIKKYYNVLILSIVAFVIVSIIVDYIGLIRINDHLIIYFLLTFIYYLFAKNLIQRHYLKKLYNEDPEFEKKDKERNEQKFGVLKTAFNFKDMHKNPFIIYLIIIICIILLYNWLK